MKCWYAERVYFLWRCYLVLLLVLGKNRRPTQRGCSSRPCVPPPPPAPSPSPWPLTGLAADGIVVSDEPGPAQASVASQRVQTVHPRAATLVPLATLVHVCRTGGKTPVRTGGSSTSAGPVGKLPSGLGSTWDTSILTASKPCHLAAVCLVLFGYWRRSTHTHISNDHRVKPVIIAPER